MTKLWRDFIITGPLGLTVDMWPQVGNHGKYKLFDYTDGHVVSTTHEDPDYYGICDAVDKAIHDNLVKMTQFCVLPFAWEEMGPIETLDGKTQLPFACLLAPAWANQNKLEHSGKMSMTKKKPSKMSSAKEESSSDQIGELFGIPVYETDLNRAYAVYWSYHVQQGKDLDDLEASDFGADTTDTDFAKFLQLVYALETAGGDTDKAWKSLGLKAVARAAHKRSSRLTQKAPGVNKETMRHQRNHH